MTERENKVFTVPLSKVDGMAALAFCSKAKEGSRKKELIDALSNKVVRIQFQMEGAYRREDHIRAKGLMVLKNGHDKDCTCTISLDDRPTSSIKIKLDVCKDCQQYPDWLFSSEEEENAEPGPVDRVASCSDSTCGYSHLSTPSAGSLPERGESTTPDWLREEVRKIERQEEEQRDAPDGAAPPAPLATAGQEWPSTVVNNGETGIKVARADKPTIGSVRSQLGDLANEAFVQYRDLIDDEEQTSTMELADNFRILSSRLSDLENDLKQIDGEVTGEMFRMTRELQVRERNCPSPRLPDTLASDTDEPGAKAPGVPQIKPGVQKSKSRVKRRRASAATSRETRSNSVRGRLRPRKASK
ncbi:unnamed protein product [Oikopleura dioica]|uniref:Uncharacterized protein n=1 Tax=Oikopleura dioica TaxID=34765 RepID=E4WXY6_OIKDI|nr:unnamed protein product [Oikopleura dioica]